MDDCKSHQNIADDSMLPQDCSMLPQDCSLLGWLTPLLWSLMQIKEVFAVSGGAEGLVRLLGSSSNMDLLVETAWVICHATYSQPDANRLVHLGLVQPAVQQIHACASQVWQAFRLPRFYISHSHDNRIENGTTLRLKVLTMIVQTRSQQPQR